MILIPRALACGIVLVGLSSATSGNEPPVTALTFAPDGRSLIVGSSRGIEVRAWPNLSRSRTIPTRLRQVHDLAISPAGDVLIAVGGGPGESGEVERFHWPEGASMGHLAPHDDQIHAVAWRGDGQAIVTASVDGLALVHTFDGGDPIPLEGHSRGVLAAAFLGTTVVTAGLDQSVRVWDAGSGGLVRALNNHTGPVVGLAVRPHAPEGAPPLIATIGLDRTARLWQPTIGRLVRLARLDSPPLAVTWASRGTLLAVACADGSVRLIDPETVTILRTLPALQGWAHSLAASPSGDALAVGGEGGAIVRLENLEAAIREK
ncbi:MAG: WD40 repeat domain-containing protein [Isosphaeraceae bacterium]